MRGSELYKNYDILRRLVRKNQPQLNTLCFEDSKWLLVNDWTGIFLAATG